MGLPGSSTFGSYGAPYSNASSIENPTTDLPAPLANQFMADCAGMTRTATRAWARFTAAASTGAMTLNDYDTTWGEVFTNVAPVEARSSTGVFTLTFPQTITDSLGNTYTVNFRRAAVSVEGSTLYLAQCSVTAANVITCYVFNTSFAANDAVGAVLHVWAQ